MSRISRRRFLAAAAAMGAAVACAESQARPSRLKTTERRDLYPEGVASGDPRFDSVVLWTRRPLTGRNEATLLVEVAQDADFENVIAQAKPVVRAESDFTCR